MDKLFQLSRTLTKEEKQRFQLFLESPYFLIPNYLKEFGNKWFLLHEASDWSPIGKIESWRGIYEEKKFDDGFWRKRKSELTDAIKRFLAVDQNIEFDSELRKEVSWLRKLSERNLSDLFENRFRRVYNSIATSPYSSEEEISDRISLFDLGYNHWLTKRDPNKPNDFEVKLLKKREQFVDDLYHLRKLKLYCALKNRIMMRAPVPSFSASLEDHVNDQKNENEPLLKIYSLLGSYLNDLDKTQGEDYLIALRANHQLIDRQERSSLFLYAINTLIRVYIKTKELKYAEELFSIYKLGLETGSLFNDLGMLLPGHFKNICSVSNRLKNWEFTKKFIRQYEKRLSNGESVEHVATYCRANLAFAQGRFKQCLSTLQSIRKVGYLKSEARTIEIKALLELGRLEELDYAIANYERWLQRSNLEKDRINMQLERVRILKRIVNMKPGDLVTYKEIFDDIVRNKVHDREWLIAKLKTMK